MSRKTSHEMSLKLSDLLTRPSLWIDDHGILRHTTSNCIQHFTADPELILDDINLLLPLNSISSLKQKTELALSDQKIANRLKDPVTTLFKYIDTLPQHQEILPQHIDKDYLELLRWLLLSHGNEKAWDIKLLALINLTIEHKIGHLPSLLNMSAEELLESHGVIQAWLQMMDGMERAQIYGGPLMPGEKQRDGSLVREDPLSNFSIFKERSPIVGGDAKDYRLVLEAHLTRIHLAIDAHNSIVLDKLKESTRSDAREDRAVEQPAPNIASGIEIKDTIHKLVPSFNETEILLQQLINTIESQTKSQQKNQEVPYTQAKASVHPSFRPRPSVVLYIEDVRLDFGKWTKEKQDYVHKEFLTQFTKYRHAQVQTRPQNSQPVINITKLSDLPPCTPLGAECDGVQFEFLRWIDCEDTFTDDFLADFKHISRSLGRPFISENDSTPLRSQAPLSPPFPKLPKDEEMEIRSRESLKYSEADDYHALQEFKIKSRARAEIAKAKIAKACRELAVAKRDIAEANFPRKAGNEWDDEETDSEGGRGRLPCSRRTTNSEVEEDVRV